MTAPDQPIELVTTMGPVRLRAEQAGDEAFLFTVFRAHTMIELAALPVDAATREALVRMQFNAQTASYRANYQQARFDIVEIEGQPVGRIVVDAGSGAEDGEPGCIVDFALLPDRQRRGLGSAILAAVLQRFIPLRRKMRCKVLMHNEPSIRMCRRVGFRQIDQETPFLQLEWRPDA